MENEGVAETFYQEGDQDEEVNVEKRKLLQDSFLSQFERGVTEYVKEDSKGAQMIFSRLNMMNYEVVEVSGRGCHGAACKLRGKDKK